ncbi:MAG: hypothetical protein HQL52_16250 [Magnetococcales bacterium]|nr:hypothetical protein [Magnetococcales bacterium]
MRKLFGGILSLTLMVSAILLPILAYYAHEAQAKVDYLSRQRQLLKTDISRLNPRYRKLEQVRHYVDRTTLFTQRAHTAGLSPKAWDRHRVSFKDREVPFRELGWLSANTRPGTNYYFIPKSLEVKTPNADDWKTREVTDQGIENLKHVLVSLEGEYWVRDPMSDETTLSALKAGGQP